MNLACGEQALHGVLEVVLSELLRFGFRLFGERRGREIRGGSFVADVVAPAGKPPQQVHEHHVHFGFAGEPVEVRDAAFWQEQAVLVAQHDGLTERAVLVLLELELAKIVVGLIVITRP